MKTISFTARNIGEIHSQLKQYLTDDFKPGIAFIFATKRQGILDISAALAQYNFKVFGFSTAGNILVDGSDQVIFEDAAVITLLELNQDYYAYMIRERGDLNSFELGQEIGRWGHDSFEKPAFIVGTSGLSMNGQEFVEGVLDTAGDQTCMFGGSASDEAKFEQNYIFSSQEVLENGAMAIAFDTKYIDISGIATSGWVGLGKDLTITSSESNIVYEIDHEPALKVYKQYLNVQDIDLPAIGVEYPLLIKRDNGSFALRAVMAVDRKKEALIFAGTVPQDATVTFSSSPGFEVMDRTKDRINMFYKTNDKAEMMLIFSCMARHLALGPIITEEILFPTEKWKIPMSGFFTFGEIGTNPDMNCDFFNQTYTLVILKEK